ncbi:hypothetical protein LXL04_007424 [Taraxacum kok-saghyz]
MHSLETWSLSLSIFTHLKIEGVEKSDFEPVESESIEGVEKSVELGFVLQLDRFPLHEFPYSAPIKAMRDKYMPDLILVLFGQNWGRKQQILVLEVQSLAALVLLFLNFILNFRDISWWIQS